jgi:hypothetical protein
VPGRTWLIWRPLKSSFGSWQGYSLLGLPGDANSTLSSQNYSLVSAQSYVLRRSLIASPDRCEQLSCPLLALDVFGDYAKYNLKLTLPGARQLLHSLHVEHPLDRVIAASALYSVYSLTPISRDLISCSMLVSACFKHNSDDSLIVAKSLLPHLHSMLNRTKPPPENSAPPKKSVDKTDAWLQWTLKKIDKALSIQNNSRAEWLRDWRLRNGHILEPSHF